MKKMLIISLASAFMSVAFAQDTAKFDEHKKMVIGELEKVISIAQTEKSCMESATNFEGIKKCRETAKMEREKIQSDRKQMRSQKIDEHIKKLQDEKAKLETEKKK